MSITSRINEMSSHIEQAYDELQGLGADLTNVNKNIENISMVLDDIYDSLPSVSGEGTSLTLDDTRVGKIKSTLKGNASQTGTPTPSSPIPVNVVSGDNEINVVGKNLFNYRLFPNNTISGITLTNNNDGSVTINGTATATSVFEATSLVAIGENYKISGCYGGSSSTYKLDFFNSSTLIFYACFNGEETTLPNNITGKARIVVYSGTTVNNVKIYPMLSTIGGEFQPYQGNTYNIDLGVENLWDTSKLQSGYLNQSGSYPTTNPSFPNARYRLVYLYKGQSITTYRSTSYGDFRMRYIDVDTNLIVGTVGVGDNGGYCSSNVTYQGSFNNGTITALKDVILGLFDYGGNMAEATITYGTKIQAISPTPIELCKIGNYQDYFYKDSGKWYKYGTIGEYVLKGNESWELQSINSYGIANFHKVYNLDYIGGVNNLSYTNYFGSQETGIASTQNVGYLLNSSKALFIRFDSNVASTVEDFKAWLSTHNVKIKFVLPTPTNTEITYQPLIEQLNELEKAISYERQTNISQVNNDLPFIISASALKEWQESASLNSTLSMVNPLSLGNTLNTQEIENDIQPIEVDNIEPLEEEENEES